MQVNESSENYLETILMLSKTHPVVRSVDIATELNFKKSSVSVAMKKLREAHHIIVSPEGFITLTETGKEIADRIYERHTLLSSWLTQLGVDPEIASEDACRMEHVISAESFESRLIFPSTSSKFQTIQKQFSAFRLSPCQSDQREFFQIRANIFFSSSAECHNFLFSSSLKLISNICSAPFFPRTVGILRHRSCSPYSPFK